jgi:putative membrane protein
MAQAPAPHFDATPSASNHFAYIRTRLAAERTLMAWVRTCTALIGFGFTIVQFLQRMESMPGVSTARRPEAPREVGLALIGAGVAGLLISVIQYRKLIRYLHGNFPGLSGSDAGLPGRTPLAAVALALVLIGIFAFCAIFFRMA